MEKKSTSLRLPSLLYKIVSTNLGACKPTIYTIYTSHMRWNSITRHRFYHTDLGQNCSSISQFCNTNCTHSVFRTIEARVGLLLTKPLKKMPKITYTASRFSLLQFELWSSVWMNINRVTLQHNKEFIMFIFFYYYYYYYFIFNVFIDV